MRSTTSIKHAKWFAKILLVFLFAAVTEDTQAAGSDKIDRKALVSRHNITITDKNLKGPTQVGNGEFAYGFDITGMQTFTAAGNTMSNWGWHEFPLPTAEKPTDFKGGNWDTQGRMIRYDVFNPSQNKLMNWMWGNPQRLNLGRFGLVLKKKDGSQAVLADLQNAIQQVNLWTGIVTSTFELEGKKIKVTTVGDPKLDAVAVKIEADELGDGRIGVFVEFPYASRGEFGNGADWNNQDKHQTDAILKSDHASFHRKLDNAEYDVKLQWKTRASIKNTRTHRYELTLSGNEPLEIGISFTKIPVQTALPSFDKTQNESIKKWEKFWNSGGAIDLSGSKDPRWKELERRIVLSQYTMAMNEAGSLPPQESGLVNNGWYGKFHFEMIWWHSTHYALWNRWSLVNPGLDVYADHLESSKERAKNQGYEGARWPKTIGDKTRWEWPNEINPLLIWQQPHPIFFAELDYRAHPNAKTLAKWKDIVMQSADFMASYAFLNKEQDRYILGYPLQVVSENADPRTTYNPTFELSYWRTGLRLAQEWRKRLGIEENLKYAEVLNKLSPLPVKDGFYVSWENINDMWKNYTFEHPALIGAYGMLPGDGVDTATMKRTLKKVGETWKFDHTWGWDFPMLSMCAARLGAGDKAVDYLLNYPGFRLEEHGLVDGGGPFPYFPGNGGLLYAVAMMAAGWDGAPGGNAPGFPKDGSWTVKWEGLKKAL
ncbi:hypothetical protein [Pedobacter metabolipauper]|uniref:Glycosyl hydrolase family 65 n=1 Tax=Pedobacter metabolipauper TaxID=425513 RepID=A0A4R6T0N4_9SPHI|nr:hypothetical protein [Pedobacter metabolipauper]TDQ11040.1 hypothetical protein ATK78_0154 [Pedobacter metabolipauper]